MPQTLSDRRTVRILATRQQVGDLLGVEARRLGFIDFEPDHVDIIYQGADDFELAFSEDFPTETDPQP